jgi:hypothetical protein
MVGLGHCLFALEIVNILGTVRAQAAPNFQAWQGVQPNFQAWQGVRARHGAAVPRDP